MADPATILARLKGLDGAIDEVTINEIGCYFIDREDYPSISGLLIRLLDPISALGAALALVEKVLPGWELQLFQRKAREAGGGWGARLSERGGAWRTISSFEHNQYDLPMQPTGSLAILVALFAVLNRASPALATASEEKGR